MKTAKFEFYRDKSKQFRWRLKARNGKIVADSSESYSSESKAKRAIESFEVAVFEALDMLLDERGA